MYTEDNMVMISALQHLVFCERQCALIHVEQQWAENRTTILGELMHEKVHSASTENRKKVRTARALKLVSYELGLVGQTDVVEFYRQDDSCSNGVTLEDVKSKWMPCPVEYKLGKPKKNRSDEVQLCAQALCLEEQFNTTIPEGALFYGKRKRRKIIEFDKSLRSYTVTLSRQLHELIESGKTPPAQYGPKCKNCSLYDICSPKWVSSMTRRGYERMLFSDQT